MKRLTMILRPLVVVVIIVTLAAVALSGCLGGNNTTPPPGTHIVNIISSGYGAFAFSPESLTIQLGENVTWTNNAGVDHTVFSENATDPFSSGILAVGHSFTHEFNRIGVFHYHCTLHPTMIGTVTVTA